MIVTEAELRVTLGLATRITDEERAVLMIAHREAEAAVKRFLKYDPQYAEQTEFLPMGDQVGSAYGYWDVTGSRATLQPYDIANELIVPRIPLRSITSLRVDRDGRFGTRAGSFGADTAWTEGEDFYPSYELAGVCRSGVIQASTSWPVVAGSVKIVYYAGLTADELAGRGTNTLVDGSGISHAVKIAAAKFMETYMSRRKRRGGWTGGGLVSENLGDYSYSLDSAAAMAATGMVNELPPESRQACEGWVHWGVMAF